MSDIIINSKLASAGSGHFELQKYSIRRKLFEKDICFIRYSNLGPIKLYDGVFFSTTWPTNQIIYHINEFFIYPDWVDDQLTHDESVGKYVMTNRVQVLSAQWMCLNWTFKELQCTMFGVHSGRHTFGPSETPTHNPKKHSIWVNYP